MSGLFCCRASLFQPIPTSNGETAATATTALQNSICLPGGANVYLIKIKTEMKKHKVLFATSHANKGLNRTHAFTIPRCKNKKITCKLACVASVFNRVIARKLERKQKKGYCFLPLSQLSRRTSRGNACYAGYLQVSLEYPSGPSSSISQETGTKSAP